MKLIEVLHDIAAGPETPDSLCPDPAALRAAMGEVMRGEASPAQTAALLMGLRTRGERAEHLHAVVEVMLEHATPVPGAAHEGWLFDTCGTGGDRHGTVNISTATAILAAAAGLPVAKHGNRAVSSRSGSADVLEALGIRIDCPPALSGRMLADLNFCFLFAPLYHPAMKHAGPVRREIKVRTVFNLAGPLSNPARPSHQLVGVSHPDLVAPMMETLRLLGRRRALVVHGANGEDEISLTQITTGLHLTADGRVENFRLEPRALGLEIVEMGELVAEGPAASAEALRRVFAGAGGPVADAININLAAVLWMADREATFEQAFNHAREIQRSGVAAALLDKIIAMSQDRTA
jgi:anthranilate phosphoribosyltransferase